MCSEAGGGISERVVHAIVTALRCIPIPRLKIATYQMKTLNKSTIVLGFEPAFLLGHVFGLLICPVLISYFQASHLSHLPKESSVDCLTEKHLKLDRCVISRRDQNPLFVCLFHLKPVNTWLLFL